MDDITNFHYYALTNLLNSANSRRQFASGYANLRNFNYASY